MPVFEVFGSWSPKAVFFFFFFLLLIQTNDYAFSKAAKVDAAWPPSGARAPGRTWDVLLLGQCALRGVVFFFFPFTIPHISALEIRVV